MDATKGPQVALTLDWRGVHGADLVDIIRKGRFPLKSVRIDLHGERAATQPKRLLKVSLHFHIEGDVPEDRVERAIALSKDTYCSVWHSLRQDIAFETSFEVISAAPGSGT